jgi:HKD family nuclease
MKLFTNSNDAILKTRLEQLCKNSTVYISTAFFSNYEFIRKCLDNNCEIYLIVRLDFGTKPDALLKIIELRNPNINMRYYACKEFHPKFYIIENICAFIGSSNLTYKGLLNNLEVNVEIESENPIYDDLLREFWFEWEHARPLTKERIIQFKNKYDQYSLLDSNRIFFTENEKVSVPKVKDLKYTGEEYLEIEKKTDEEINLNIKYLKKEFIEHEFTTPKKKEYYNNTYQRYLEVIEKLGTKKIF